MAFFSEARDFTITGGTFINQTHSAEGEKGRELLAKRVAQGALHNSAERYDPPKCHPRTRRAILRRIRKWIHTPESQARFFWIFGPAGSGKSAIAQTIAEICFKWRQLAATFFFSRNSVTRNNELMLITTLVYQLANSFPEMRELVEQRIERDPIILDLSLEAQVESLLVQPLNAVLPKARTGDEDSYLFRPRLVILDGLDECGDGNTQKYILEVLSRAVVQVSFPLIFLVTSRPEPAIRNSFNKVSMSNITKRLPLDDTYEPDEDIKIVIESKCEEIRETHPARASLPSPWPSHHEIEQLVTKSSGQFIYTSTVLKFIESPKHRPQDRLSIIFGISAPENDAPFAELDALYRQIFSTVIDFDKLRDVLSVILLATHVPKTQAAIEEFLSYSPGTVDILLSDLSSIIALPLPEEAGGQIQILHASLTDFLYDRSRSVDMFIDAEAAHAFIGIRLIHRFNQPPPQTQEDGNDSFNVTRLYDRLMFPKHCFFAGSSVPLLDNLYTFDLAGYLGWFRPSDSIFVRRRLSMSLKSLNKAKNDPIRYDIVEDTGLHVPSFRGAIHGTSKDGHGTLSMDLVDGTSAYIKLANLDPEIRVMTKSISMRETYITTVRSSADIPKFLLWLQEKNTPNHTNDLFHHHLTAIDAWIHKQLEVPIIQNFQSSFLESTVSHRFNLEKGAQKLFDILKDEEQEAQVSSDAILLSILVRQSGIDLTRALHLWLPWDHTNDSAYYTLLKEFLTDPTRAGPYFFNDEKIASLTEKILRFTVKRGIHNESVIFYPDPLRRILTGDILQELSKVDMSTPGPAEVFQDCGVLTLIPYMLERAAKTREVENILRNHPFKFDDVNDVLHNSKQKCAEAALAYLEKCREQRVLDEKTRAKTRTAATWHITQRNYPPPGVLMLLIAVVGLAALPTTTTKGAIPQPLDPIRPATTLPHPRGNIPVLRFFPSLILGVPWSAVQCPILCCWLLQC